VDAYLLEAVRTPFGRHRGGLANIRTDDLAALPIAELLRAGGVESMSRAPFVLPKPDVPFPTEAKLWHTQVGWRMINPKFPAHWTARLGACAEKVADELGIGREEQDEWSLRSHERAGRAWDAGLHEDYVIVVEGPAGTVKRDESIRGDTTAAKLSGSNRRSARTARSPRATPHPSTMARSRCWSVPRGRPRIWACRCWGGSWPA
jgi:acetyl-CoA acetyltransferase